MSFILRAESLGEVILVRFSTSQIKYLFHDMISSQKWINFQATSSRSDILILKI